jgi:hypothetical protein
MVRAGDSEPHWTLVGYTPLAVVAGGLLDEGVGRLRRLAEVAFRAALLLSAAVVILYAANLRSPALMMALPSYNPDADPYTETLGWDRVARAVGAHASSLGAGTVAAGAHNVLCGHLQAAIDDTPPVYCASARRTEYDFVRRRSPPPSAPVVFVDSDRYPGAPESALPGHRCARVEDVEVARAGRLVARYRIHECLPISAGPDARATSSLTSAEGAP